MLLRKMTIRKARNNKAAIGTSFKLMIGITGMLAVNGNATKYGEG